MNKIIQLKTALMVIVCMAASTCGLVAQDIDIRAKFQEAFETSQAGDYEKALELFREIEKADDSIPILAFHIGYNLHASGKIDEAIGYHEKAAKVEQTKVLGLYNLACAYSLKKDADKAFDYLQQSIEAGYHGDEQLRHIKTDSDFDNVREDSRFGDMLAMMENGGKMPEKKTADKLLGTWSMESGMKAGAKIEASHLSEVKITKKSFTMPSSAGEPFVMSYKVDMSAKPVTIDFKIESGPMAVGAKSMGIIKMDGDGMMSLCYDPKGESRPEKISSSEENGFFVFKLKKSMEKTEAKEKKSLAKQMQGKWQCIKGVRAGEEVAADRMASTISIDEKTIRIPVSEDQAFVMSYKIDESKSPVTIDMKVEEGPAPPESRAVGIIKMEDGKFFLCYDSMGADRPDSFKADGEGQFYFEMKKAED